MAILTIVTEKLQDGSEYYHLKENFGGDFEISREFQIDTNQPDYDMAYGAAAYLFIARPNNNSRLCNLVWPSTIDDIWEMFAERSLDVADYLDDETLAEINLDYFFS